MQQFSFLIVITRLLLVLIFWGLFSTSFSFAGGGPENVFLVVNGNSWASRTIGQEYIRLRKIPLINVFYLEKVTQLETISVDEFRSQIMQPILDEIKKRRLTQQIDYIVYSSDIPNTIHFKSDLGEEDTPAQMAPIGSITGLTYLYHPVMRKAKYLDLDNNWYCGGANTFLAPRAFHHSTRWALDGSISKDPRARNYYLSMMLGVTSGRANSVEEVLSYLRRSAQADGSHPKGTIYYMSNKDVRAKTREWGFQQAIDKLKEIGIAAVIEEGKIPLQKKDVLGTQVGIAKFDWKASQSEMLPGAICEHLTSFGGILREKAGQTPLTEFLRYGAAGASGTVHEPYSIQHKFPNPFIQFYYAKGASLAEAFYQSIRGPYQILLVGDPLCQPFATIPKVTLKGLKEGQKVKGTLELLPTVEVEKESVKHLALYIDGLLKQEIKSGESFSFNTTRYSDGRHELRIVATCSGALETQGRIVLPFYIENTKHLIKITGISKKKRKKYSWEKELVFKVFCKNANRIAFYHHGYLITEIKKQKGKINIPLSLFGKGIVQIQPIAYLKDGGELVGKTIEIEVAPKALKGESVQKTKKGMRFLLGKNPEKILGNLKTDLLQKNGWKNGEKFTLEGRIEIKKEGMYHFQIKGTEDLLFQMGKEISPSLKAKAWNSIPVFLGEGFHSFVLSGTCGDSLDVRFGNSGSKALTSAFVFVPPENKKNKRKKRR